MAKPSPLFAASGSQHLLRTRFVRTTIKAQQKGGWRVDYANGAVGREVQDALSQGGLFFEGNVVVVVRNPEKVPLSLYEEHLAEGGS